MEEFFSTDIESLYSKLKHQEKRFKIKRRWLLGQPLSDSEQKQLNKLKSQENKTLPESFLREDDVYYESVKASVEKGIGTCTFEREYDVDQYNIRSFDLPSDLRNLFSMLDDMTNNGLQIFAEILTGGSIKFEKTRSRMKKIIRECLQEILVNWKDNYKLDTAEKLCQLLRSSHNFRRNHATLLTPASESYHAAATKILHGLEDMPFQALSAMHRKLRGIQGFMPQLQPPKSGWGRSILIDQVRKRCMAMLSKLVLEDEPQEPLAKAMAVGGLSSNLMRGCPFVAEFWQFSTDIEALQHEIAKAIWLLKEKVTFTELKNLQQLLDPNAEVSNRSLRTAVKNLLIEFLFECSDMDTIPDYLLETLSIINRTSRSAPYRFFSKEDIEEEVECVLSVSAQIKQILWDLLPEYEFDQDFADAYMEDLEESDGGDDCDSNDIDDKQEVVLPQKNLFHPNDPHDQIETVGETNPANSESPTTAIKENGSSPVLSPNRRLNSDYFEKVEPEHITRMDLVDSVVSASSSSCYEFDRVENREGNQSHKGSVRNLELNDPHLLTLRTNGNRNGCSSNFPTDARVNANHVERQEPTGDPEKPPDFVSSNSSCEGNCIHDKLHLRRNQYLAVQEACDKTSMVAYRLIGCVLDEISQTEGLDLDWSDVSYFRGDNSVRKDSEVAEEEHISNEKEVRGSTIVQVLEELLPSFRESGKERVKELMGLK